MLRCEVPAASLLADCASAGAYADCYCVGLDRPVSQQEFIEAFYTTPLFRVERLILRWVVARPSTDLDARALAQGTADTFAAWNVADRRQDELLLADYRGRTRSWLKAAPLQGPAGAGSGRGGMGLLFTALLGFHKLYSRALLASARHRLGG